MTSASRAIRGSCRIACVSQLEPQRPKETTAPSTVAASALPGDDRVGFACRRAGRSAQPAAGNRVDHRDGDVLTRSEVVVQHALAGPDRGGQGPQAGVPVCRAPRSAGPPGQQVPRVVRSREAASRAKVCASYVIRRASGVQGAARPGAQAARPVDRQVEPAPVGKLAQCVGGVRCHPDRAGRPRECPAGLTLRHVVIGRGGQTRLANLEPRPPPADRFRTAA